MKIIIPMAGFGKRFKDAGYREEKYEILWKDKTLFEHSINSLSDFFEYEFVFIGRSSSNFREKVERLIKKTNVIKYQIVSLSTPTNGQAETVYNYTKTISDSDILVFNIDTYINPNIVKKADIKTRYWWLVSDLPGEKWSFIKINEDGSFLASEKKRISNLASLGMYYFSSSNEFNRIFIERGSEIKELWKEIYIAPMFNYVCEQKGMSISKISKGDFKILGTPEDLKNAN